MSKKILLVDDDFNITELLLNFLQMKGFDVETAENGYYALKKIEVFKPDIVLLDIMMPRLDGFEVCNKIRTLSDGSLSKSPIIIISALNHLNDVKKAITAGANDYIVKPINLQILFDKINRYIKIDAILKKEGNADNSMTLEKLEKGLVVSFQGKIDRSTFETFQKNIHSFPAADFVILFFQNIVDVGNTMPMVIDDMIELYSVLNVKKKVVAAEQKDMVILLEAACLKRRIVIYNTLMEAYENIKKDKS